MGEENIFFLRENIICTRTLIPINILVIRSNKSFLIKRIFSVCRDFLILVTMPAGPW